MYSEKVPRMQQRLLAFLCLGNVSLICLSFRWLWVLVFRRSWSILWLCGVSLIICPICQRRSLWPLCSHFLGLLDLRLRSEGRPFFYMLSLYSSWPACRDFELLKRPATAEGAWFLQGLNLLLMIGDMKALQGGHHQHLWLDPRVSIPKMKYHEDLGRCVHDFSRDHFYSASHHGASLARSLLSWVGRKRYPNAPESLRP